METPALSILCITVRTGITEACAPTFELSSPVGSSTFSFFGLGLGQRRCIFSVPSLLYPRERIAGVIVRGSIILVLTGAHLVVSRQVC